MENKNRELLAKIKDYLGEMSEFNRIAKPELVNKWIDVYCEVYKELNGVDISHMYVKQEIQQATV